METNHPSILTLIITLLIVFLIGFYTYKRDKKDKVFSKETDMLSKSFSLRLYGILICVMISILIVLCKKVFI